jgi:hypothetical protein
MSQQEQQKLPQDPSQAEKPAIESVEGTGPPEKQPDADNSWAELVEDPIVDPAGSTKALDSRSARIASVTAVLCVVFVSVTLQNLWQFARRVLADNTGLGSPLPVVVLGGLALIVAVVICLLLISRLVRLLFTVRMNVTLLVALALFVLSSSAFENEGLEGAAGRAGSTNDANVASVFSATVFSPDMAKKSSHKVMGLVRTLTLTNLSGSWVFCGLAALLVISSLLKLIWRRPLGAREFGFIAAHGGVVLIGFSLLLDALLGSGPAVVRLSMNKRYQMMPPGSGHDGSYAIRLKALKEVQVKQRLKLLVAADAQGGWQQLAIDPTKSGSIDWRGRQIEILEYRDSAIPELVMTNDPALNNPALKIEFKAGKKDYSSILYVHNSSPQQYPDEGVEFTYIREHTVDDAARSCRLPYSGDLEGLLVLAVGSKKPEIVNLSFGHEKVGKLIFIKSLGLQCKVLRWYAGAWIKKDGSVVKAAPVRGTVPAIEMELTGDGKTPEGSDPAKPFWIAGSHSPVPALGSLPPEMLGVKFHYVQSFWQPLAVRIVEGPRGVFQAAELMDGKVIKVRSVDIGKWVSLEGGVEFRITDSVDGAQMIYIPAAAGSKSLSQGAVRLKVSNIAEQKSEKVWFFPGLSRPFNLCGIKVCLRPNRSKSNRAASAVLEVRDSAGVREVVVGSGAALRQAGYSLFLHDARFTGNVDGGRVGYAVFSLYKRPGLWFFWAGLLLISLGVPWLLWSRFRHLPDTVGSGG